MDICIPVFLWLLTAMGMIVPGGYGVATGGPYAWGLYYNKEMSPMQSYCDDYHKYIYPCSPGAEHYGRDNVTNLTLVLPSTNYNYGAAGDALKVDLLNHPEYIKQNATLAFQAAVWRWMTPIKKSQPSAHQAFVGDWKPTKNDTLICGKGDIDAMNNIVSHYQYYLDLMGVGQDEAGPHEVLTCAEQVRYLIPVRHLITAYKRKFTLLMLSAVMTLISLIIVRH
ncbi:unnamed protein product [Malus baccata var. baccata]